MVPNPILLVMGARRTSPAHNDRFLLQAFQTLSLPGSFLWYMESLLSWEFKGPVGKPSTEEERQLKESHPSFSATWWVISAAGPTQLLGVSPVGSQVPTAVSYWSVLLLSAFLPPLSHFPYSFTCFLKSPSKYTPWTQALGRVSALGQSTQPIL